MVDLSFRGSGEDDGSSLYDTREQYSSSDSDGEQGGDGDAGAAVSLLGPEYRRSLTCPNPEETNSAVEVTFQVRKKAPKRRRRGSFLLLLLSSH